MPDPSGIIRDTVDDRLVGLYDRMFSVGFLPEHDGAEYPARSGFVADNIGPDGPVLSPDL